MPFPGHAPGDEIPVTARIRSRPIALTLGLALATAAALGPVPADDLLKTLQTENVKTAKKKIGRVYHFGSQGNPGVFSNHTSHSNRLIPVYVFGRKADLASVTGKNSVYRSA